MSQHCPTYCDHPQKGASTLRSWGLFSDKLEPLGFPGLGWAAAAAASGQNNAVQAPSQPAPFWASTKNIFIEKIVLKNVDLRPPAPLTHPWSRSKPSSYEQLLGGCLFIPFVCLFVCQVCGIFISWIVNREGDTMFEIHSEKIFMVILFRRAKGRESMQRKWRKGRLRLLHRQEMKNR